MIDAGGFIDIYSPSSWQEMSILLLPFKQKSYTGEMRHVILKIKDKARIAVRLVCTPQAWSVQKAVSMIPR